MGTCADFNTTFIRNSQSRCHCLRQIKVGSTSARQTDSASQLMMIVRADFDGYLSIGRPVRARSHRAAVGRGQVFDRPVWMSRNTTNRPTDRSGHGRRRRHRPAYLSFLAVTQKALAAREERGGRAGRQSLDRSLKLLKWIYHVVPRRLHV